MKEQILIFVTMQEKKKIDLANCQSQKKSQTCKSRQLYHRCCKLQCTYCDAMSTLFAQYTQPE